MTKSELLSTAKPILFNTEMVRAIQDNRKTMTRRVIKPQPCCDNFIGTIISSTDKASEGNFAWAKVKDGVSHCCEAKPHYKHGDILYVRETFYQYGEWHTKEIRIDEDNIKSKHVFVPCGINKPIYYHDTLPKDIEIKHGFKAGRGYYKRPSIFMSKETARIFLKVTSVRVERLQDISVQDAKAEGKPEFVGKPAKLITEHVRTKNAYIADFAGLWDSTIKKSDLGLYGWDADPWVWVYKFERVEVV